MNSPKHRLAGVALSAVLASPLLAQVPSGQTPSTLPTTDANSTVVMCGSPDFASKRSSLQFLPPSDCGFNSNTAGASYNPSYNMVIPVVWHVITNSNGSNNVTDAQVIQQMQFLNDDFRPPAGALGNDSGIIFELASADPNGAPTNGINRIANSQWHGDSGNYSQTLSWDSNRYLNIYTLSPFGGGGVIGYVPDLPQGGTLVGTTNDGVRMLWSAISSSNFNHVLSHEIGHHLGLFHTFSGCSNSNCQTQGDLICDTNPHSSPTNNCSGNPGSCSGQLVPRNNYMNYQNVACVWEFSPGQIQRMRCTLENWRSMLWAVDGPVSTFCDPGSTNSAGTSGQLSYTGSIIASDNNLTLEITGMPLNEFGFFLNGTGTGFIMNPGGSFGNLCLADAIGRYNSTSQIFNSGATGAGSLVLDLTQTPSPTSPTVVTAGQTVHFQGWYRDSVFSTSNLTNGLSITFE